MGGSERYTVVAANVGGQTPLFKKPLKHSKSVIFSVRGKRLTSEKKTASMIGDRQRIAVMTIAQQELALVIGTPQFVGTLA